MPQSFAQIYLHIVYSTKYRTPWLRDRPIRIDMHSYLGGICRSHAAPAEIVGGVEDHVHILCRLPRTLKVSQLLWELKRGSSLWIKEKGAEFADFHWQDGYGAFSVSPAHVPALRSYIANQEAHHATESFQDEYRRFLAEYGLEYDERYVWD